MREGRGLDGQQRGNRDAKEVQAMGMKELHG